MARHKSSTCFQVEVIAETEEALLLEDENGDQQWFPRSCIEKSTCDGGGELEEQGDVGQAWIYDWIAEQKVWL